MPRSKNERVLGKTGMISRKTVEIPLLQGEGIVVDQSILGRILTMGKSVVQVLEPQEFQ